MATIDCYVAQKFEKRVWDELVNSHCSCELVGKNDFNPCLIHGKRCSKCGIRWFEHGDKIFKKSFGEHPFFSNNLEMLEHYSAKKERLAA